MDSPSWDLAPSAHLTFKRILTGWPLGANYVNISHPGLFGEDPPYVLDEAVQDNLDRLLDMIAKNFT